MSLSVLHAPLHAPSAAQRPAVVVREIRRHRPTLVGLSEAYGILPELGRMRGYRLVVEDGGKDRRRGQRDNPILAASSLRSLGSGQVHGCDASTPVKIAPERWLTFAAFDVPGRGGLCHVTLHPHALVQVAGSGLLRTDTDRARKFGRQMEVLVALLAFAKAMQWDVVVTGDLNFRDTGNDPRSPFTILRKAGLTAVTRGIDCIAFSPGLGLRVDQVDVAGDISDHPWLLGTVA